MVTPIYEAMLDYFDYIKNKVGGCCQGLGIDDILLGINTQGGGYLEFPLYNEDENNTVQNFCMQVNSNADMLEHVLSAYLLASFSIYITANSSETHTHIDLLCKTMKLPVEVLSYALYCTVQMNGFINLEHLQTLTEKVAAARVLQIGSVGAQCAFGRKRLRME